LVLLYAFQESVLLPVTTNSTKRFRRHHIKDYSSGAAKKRLAKAKANFQSHTDTRLKLDEKENINNLTSRQRNGELLACWKGSPATHRVENKY
jgi:hypothetical protein